jgi:predicted TIM-barrel fold metal-dependent hydrolase
MSMIDAPTAFAYARMPDLALPKDRKPENRNGFKLPAGTVVVSADSHFSVSDDIWYRRFPERLRDRAPRVVRRDGAFVVDIGGKPMLPEHMVRFFSGYDQLPGASQIESRIADLDAEGVDKEVVFGNSTLALLTYPDLEIRDWIYKIYNEHLLDLGSQAPGRFYGVALANYWDMNRARASFVELKSQGFKTFMLPLKPGKDLDGNEILYADPRMEPLWGAIEEAGLPVSFHIGETFHSGRGGFGTTGLVNINPFRQVIGQLIFGGIFDRHPKLEVMFAEAGLNWVPGLIQDAEMFNNAHDGSLDWKLAHPVRHYWEKHCYATFIVDPIGLRLLDLIGADHVMWSSDYPHHESTFGFGWTIMQQVLDAAKSDDDARKMLGGTAIRLLNLT